jgi:hypothetical protein
VISPTQTPLPDNTQNSQQTDIHPPPPPPRDSNPQSQQASGRRPNALHGAATGIGLYYILLQYSTYMLLLSDFRYYIYELIEKKLSLRPLDIIKIASKKNFRQHRASKLKGFFKNHLSNAQIFIAFKLILRQILWG